MTVLKEDSDDSEERVDNVITLDGGVDLVEVKTGIGNTFLEKCLKWNRFVHFNFEISSLTFSTGCIKKGNPTLVACYGIVIWYHDSNVT